MDKKEIDLKYEGNKKLYYDLDKLKKLKEDILEFLSEEDYMHTLDFAKSSMESIEIKANNEIEGINDNLDIIDSVIENKPVSSTTRRRIINLYRAYQFILNNKNINEESLHELFQILSNDLITNEGMGEYYRTEGVFILRNSYDIYQSSGIPFLEIEEYMKNYFDYINTDSEDSLIDKFIKSQIIHFYLVYIHPYVDLNGRVSRTASMWYLLNNGAYPYVNFNRAISFNRKNYLVSVRNASKTGNLTNFLEYILKSILIELEKDHVIQSIKENTSSCLSKEDLLMIRYLITMKEHMSIKDLATIYNHYNDKLSPKVIYDEKIKTLLDKEILEIFGKTSTFVKEDLPNYLIRINPNIFDFSDPKVKNLNLKRFIN